MGRQHYHDRTVLCCNDLVEVPDRGLAKSEESLAWITIAKLTALASRP